MILENQPYIKLEQQISLMRHEMEMTSRPEHRPSKFWVELNQKNYTQLLNNGYQNFKQTVALNYFTWTLNRHFLRDDQIRFLLTHISPIKSGIAALRSVWKELKRMVLHQPESLETAVLYNFLVYLLWEYGIKHDPSGLLPKLNEPLEGNPPKIYLGSKLLSQDLINSVLEYYSIAEVFHREDVNSILELGAGYGRNAFIFLTLHPQMKYIIVDIPPALGIAQTYLSDVFPDRKIFTFRPFTSYEEIQDDFEQAQICFLLPPQLEMLPAKAVDLFVNISSFHEMTKPKIAYYFDQVNRIIRKYLYFKEWKTTVVPFENEPITEADYPIRSSWHQIYWRPCAIKTAFFEALIDLNP